MSKHIKTKSSVSADIPIQDELQPSINVGTLGHVAHGKTSIVRGLTGIDPSKFEKEQSSNCTIRLGYANAKIYKCNTCVAPRCYTSAPAAGKAPKCKTMGCAGKVQLARHISFVDCPGHDVLMATMLSGAAVMDAGLLVVAANAPCPMPQTAEHLVAAEMMDLPAMVLAQNKIDAVPMPEAQDNHASILEFTRGTMAEGAPVIPLSATRGYNMDVLLEQLATLPEPQRDLRSPGRMVVVRSFDINKPGTSWQALKGGVAGGSIGRGQFALGQTVEVRPGLIIRDEEDGTVSHRPLLTDIVSLASDRTRLERALPGGLIGVGTNLDPSLTRGNRLVGQLIGPPGSLPEVYTGLRLRVTLMKRLVGIQSGKKVAKFAVGEALLASVGASSTKAIVLAVHAHRDAKEVSLELAGPCCAEGGERVPLSRKVDNHWRLIGWGEVLSGTLCNLATE